jgi:hypothetical protein
MRTRILLGALITIGFVFWINLLNFAKSEPKLADGVTFDGYYAARSSIGEQVGEDNPLQWFNVETKFVVELTGDEIAGVFGIEHSMHDRIDMARKAKTNLYWHAVSAFTLLFLFSLAGLIWCRSSASESLAHTSADL